MKTPIEFRAWANGEMHYLSEDDKMWLLITAIGFQAIQTESVFDEGGDDCIYNNLYDDNWDLMQLRYINKDGIKYYDGDIYYHAGYGLETVSDLCELQLSLLTGNTEDIGEIKGNIHQHPELLNQ